MGKPEETVKKETKQAMTLEEQETKHEPKGSNKSKEMVDLEIKYNRLTNSVSDLTSLVKDVMERLEQQNTQLPTIVVPPSRSKQVSAQTFVLRKVNIDGEVLEMAVYEDFVVLAGHKLKIYENLKGRFVNYMGRPIYLSLNGLHAL